jgi:hypothetical protein
MQVRSPKGHDDVVARNQPFAMISTQPVGSIKRRWKMAKVQSPAERDETSWATEASPNIAKAWQAFHRTDKQRRTASIERVEMPSGVMNTPASGDGEGGVGERVEFGLREPNKQPTNAKECPELTRMDPSAEISTTNQSTV